MWEVKIHPLVLTEDLKGLDLRLRRKIFHAIQEKLTTDPENYGKPLVGEFKGYYRLRVEDYRIIYRIVKKEIQVLVLKIGIRRDDEVYRELFKRLRKLGLI